MKDPRTRELATIHATVHKLGMDDATYRQMLWSVARVKSAADLDFAGRKTVIDHLRAIGGTFTRPGKPAGEWEWIEKTGNRAPRLRYIIVLCGKLGIERGKQVRYVEGIAENMDHRIRVIKDGKVFDETVNLRKPLQMATMGDLGAIVVALEKAVKRKEAK